MPKTIKRDLSKINKLLHPKSRKVTKLAKKSNRIVNREKSKHFHQMKENLIGEKLVWFQKHLEPDINVYRPEMCMNILDKYFARFNEELEQISVKHSIKKRKNRRHANREDIIQLTILHEKEEYATCGLEVPDLMDAAQLKLLREWNGELRFLQQFRLARYSRSGLQRSASQPVTESAPSEGGEGANDGSEGTGDGSEDPGDGSEGSESEVSASNTAETNEPRAEAHEEQTHMDVDQG